MNTTRPVKSWKFTGEVAAAASCIALALLTAVWPDWIEGVFGFDPDHGSGEAEWMIVLGLAAAGVVCGVLARIEWRRLRQA